MSVHLLANELSRWDEVEGGSLLLTFFSDERPLRGAAGLADWRLCGRLSRLIQRGRLSGEGGEKLLLPPGHRLRFQRILLFGLGDSSRFNEDLYRQHVRWIREVAGLAKIDDYALQPPGRATGLIGARRALELWLEVSDEDRHPARVAIIDSQNGQKDMAEILRFQKRRSDQGKRTEPPNSGKSGGKPGGKSGSPAGGQKSGPPGGQQGDHQGDRKSGQATDAKDGQ